MQKRECLNRGIFYAIKKAGLLLGVMASAVYGGPVLAQNELPIVIPLSSPASICDFVPWPQAEATFAEFRKRRDHLNDQKAEAKLDADTFSFLKQQIAFLDALIDVKERLRGNITTASKDLDPRSDLLNVMQAHAQSAEDQILQLKQIRLAVGSSITVTQANAVLSEAWQQDTEFATKILVGRPFGADFVGHAHGYLFSPYLGLTGIGLNLPDRDSFRKTYCYRSGEDALPAKAPLSNEQMLANELLRYGGAWKNFSGLFSLAELPLLSRNVHRVVLTEADVHESNFWAKSQLKYSAKDRLISGLEIRRHKTAWPGHRGSTLMGAKPGDIFEAHSFERLRREIFDADQLR